MLNKKSLSYFLLFFIIQLNLNGQNNGLKRINTEDLVRHLTFISSDNLQGRSLGTPFNGLDTTAAYIKSNILKMGLKDGANDYFQTVPIVSSSPDYENSFFEISDESGNLIFKTDSFIALPQGGQINVLNSQLIFAGFGYQDTLTGYNDFEGLELTGKVVLFLTGTPEWYYNNDLPRWDNALETSKVKKAIGAGAAAVVLISSPLDTVNSVYNRIQRWANQVDFSLGDFGKNSETINFAFVPFSVAEAFFDGPEELKNLLAKISTEKKPHSFIFDGKFSSLMAKSKTEHFMGKNVIGYIEGSDSVLKKECLVFMAHYDHVGMDKNGDVFNGADDNGSGTVTLLGLADAFSGLKEKPKRSIVFLWVTAEEIGLLGSQYYSENPLFPLNKTVACINIDMNGRVFEERDTIWSKSPKMVKDYDGIYVLTNNIWPGLKKINSKSCKMLGLTPDYSLHQGFLRSSDHYSFHSKGVPILNYSTGYHADYHKTSDDVSKINFDKMKRVADLCFLVGLQIANHPQIIKPEKYQSLTPH